MEAGEKEQRLAFEEVTNRNVKAAIEYSNKTREIVKGLEVKVQTLQNTVLSRDAEIAAIKKQLAVVQTIIFAGGTTSGN